MKFFEKKSKKTPKEKDEKKVEDLKKEEEFGLGVLDVDLIKGEKEKVLNWSKYVAFIFLAVVAASVLALEAYWLIGWWENQENKRALEIEKNIENLRKDIKQLDNDYKLLTQFKAKADMLDDLLAKHPYWTNFFNWIERRTLSNVSWQSFSADLSGTYSLQAEAKTFADISWQVRSFLDDDLVKSVDVNNGTGGLREERREVPGMFDEDDNPIMESFLESSVDFTLELKIDPKLFYRR
jgi:hypothetical protein